MRNFIGAFLILAFSNSALSEEAKETITFKNIPLGQSESKQVLDDLCRENKSNLETNPVFDKLLGKPCSMEGNWIVFSVDYGNLHNQPAVFKLDANGAIYQIQIEDFKNNILSLAEVLETKYGKPLKSNQSVENKLGTKFDKSVFIWSDAKGNRITIESVYENINNGRVVLDSAANVNSNTQLRKQIKEVEKNNL